MVVFVALSMAMSTGSVVNGNKNNWNVFYPLELGIIVNKEIVKFIFVFQVCFKESIYQSFNPRQCSRYALLLVFRIELDARFVA